MFFFLPNRAICCKFWKDFILFIRCLLTALTNSPNCKSFCTSVKVVFPFVKFCTSVKVVFFFVTVLGRACREGVSKQCYCLQTEGELLQVNVCYVRTVCQGGVVKSSYQCRGRISLVMGHCNSCLGKV